MQLLRLQNNEDPLQQQARTIIERQVVQLKHLIEDLLEVSRITTGRIQLHQERIVVGGIVDRALETARPLIKQHRHELTVTVPPAPIWPYADAARMEQVVVNLLTNAAKYTNDGGHIWLAVHGPLVFADGLDTSEALRQPQRRSQIRQEDWKRIAEDRRH